MRRPRRRATLPESRILELAGRTSPPQTSLLRSVSAPVLTGRVMQTRTSVLGQIEGPELFIGLVGAVGTNLRLLTDTLCDELREVAYEPHEIRLSGLIRDIPKFSHLVGLDGGPEDERINAYMDAGDRLRSDMQSGDALSLLSVMAIQDYRQEKNGNSDVPLNRHTYILNSLKHPSEVETLRRLYGRAFCLVAVYAPRAERADSWQKRLPNHITASIGTDLGMLPND